jgi:Zn-dependent M32 family carboxypeptidase
VRGYFSRSTNYLNQLLSDKEEQKSYKLSEFEKKMLAESEADYRAGKAIPDEVVISRNEKWLEE